MGEEDADNEEDKVDSKEVDKTGDFVTAFVKDKTGESVTSLVADKEKAAETLADPNTDGDDEDDNVGEVEVDILKCEDSESIGERVAVAESEKSTESVAVDVNKGVPLNEIFELIDNKADRDTVSEFEGVALVVTEFVTLFVCVKVDFGLSNGRLEDVILLVGEPLDNKLDES